MHCMNRSLRAQQGRLKLSGTSNRTSFPGKLFVHVSNRICYARSLLPYRKPRSSYYIGPPGSHTAFGTPQVGQIGVHDPREIVRIERDYQSGELPQ